MKLKSTIVGLVLFASALDGGALTLGRARGAAIVGRQLDVTIPVQLTPDETSAQLCAEADVFHGDTRQEVARVRVTVDTSQLQSPVIRVVSSNPIDEPVVTLYVRVGCGQKSTRRYVLLADIASEPAPASLPAPAAVNLPIVVNPPVAAQPAVALPAPATTAAVPAAAAAATATVQAPIAIAPAVVVPETSPELVPTAPSANTAPVAVQTTETAKPKAALPKKPKVKPAQAKPKAAPAAVPTAPVEAKIPGPPPAAADKALPVAKDAAKTGAQPAAKDAKEDKNAGQSRLKLDPLNTLADPVAPLENTAAVPSPDQAKEAQRVQTLEDSVKTLVALAAKNEASMLQMRAQLAKAESERISINWIYTLGGLLLACLAAIAWLWSRQRSAIPGERDDWWSAGKTASPGRNSQVGALAAASAQGPESVPSMAAYRAGPNAPSSVFDEVHQARTSTFGVGAAGALAAATVVVKRTVPVPDSDDVDVSLVEMSESNFDNLMQSGQAHSALRKGPLVTPVESQPTRAQPMEMARAINSDQVFDIRQQADFFVSLGQTDQAVRILEARLSESGESSPWLYLDLLQILHSLGMRQDYHQFREEFNILFNSQVPEFSAYAQEGRTLEEYPHVLAHITALWNTPKAQMVIEASVFRDPADEKSKPFDLAAFRDLLLLHAIAQNTSRAGPVNSNLAPLPRAAGAAPGAPAQPDVDIDIPLDTRNGMLPMPVVGRVTALDLDLDLSDLVIPGAASPTATLGSAKPVALMASSAKGGSAAEPGALPEITLPELPASESSTVLPLTETPAPPLVDNNFLNFDTQATVKYNLPKPKA